MSEQDRNWARKRLLSITMRSLEHSSFFTAIQSKFYSHVMNALASLFDDIKC